MRTTFDKHNEQIVAHRVAVDLVFIGESITEFWDLQVYFRTSGGLLVNRGASGDITPIMLRRFQADVIQLSPRYVHIMGGTNNTWRLAATEPGERMSPDRIFQSIVADVTSMVRLAKNSGIFPIVGSNLPIGPNVPCFDFGFLAYCPNHTSGLRSEVIAASNLALRRMAETEGAIYADYHTALAGPDGRTLRPEFSDDSLHPNVNGYDVMATVLRQSLAAKGIRI
jgi:lysophospholipase L1-like esterase